MTIVLTVLLAVLKFLGWALLFVLALLVLLLILPVELRFSYTPKGASLTAWYEPLHFSLWPRHTTEPATSSPPTAQTPHSGAAAHPVEKKSTVPPQTEATTNATFSVPAQAPAAVSAQPSDTEREDAAAPQEENSSGGLPFHISERIEAAMDLLARDPAAFARCMFGHLCWLGRGLARHIKLCHLTVFWPITGEDAAQTAELYGAAMTAANNLLAFLQQVIRLQCDHLQLEPDFTGECRGKREVSGRLHTHPILLLCLLLRLLLRLGKDPQLQPAHTN